MKKLKSVLCVLIAIVFALSIFSFSHKVNSAYAADTFWNDYATIAPVYNSTTGYYEISSPEQLAYFNKYMASYVSSKIMLTANINMINHYWTPYAVKWSSVSRNQLFCGTFDGNNYTISNLKIYNVVDNAGFFSMLDYNAKVINVNFYNCSVFGCEGYGGIIAGYLEGNSLIQNCNIINCSVSMDYNSTYTNTIWGGALIGFSYCAEIKNCMVYNSSVGFFSLHEPKYAFVGGIVGEANNTTISVCAFLNSSIYIYTNDTCHVGGIVGRLSYKNYKGTSKIEKCYTQNSTITGGYNYYCKTAYVGGIAGSMEYGTIENCYNLSTISASATTTAKQTSTNTTKWSGSHIGHQTIGSQKIDYTVNTTYSSNAYNAYAGGICGYVLVPSDCNIQKCYNSGTFSTESKSKEELTINYTGTYYNSKNVTKYNKKGTSSVNFNHYLAYDTMKNVSNIANNFAYSTSKSLYGYSTLPEKFLPGYSNTYTSSTATSPVASNSFNFTEMKLLTLSPTANVSTWVRYFLDLRTPGYYKIRFQVKGCPLPSTDTPSSWANTCMSASTCNIPVQNSTLDGWSGTDVNNIVSADTNVWILDTSISPTPIIKDFYWKYSAKKPS